MSGGTTYKILRFEFPEMEKVLGISGLSCEARADGYGNSSGITPNDIEATKANAVGMLAIDGNKVEIPIREYGNQGSMTIKVTIDAVGY